MDTDAGGIHAQEQPIRLKCKFQSDQCILSDLHSGSTVSELLNSISSNLGIPRPKLNVSYGFPPKRIDCSASAVNQRLDQVPITSGETLMVTVSNALDPSSAQSLLSTQCVNPQSQESLDVKAKPYLVRLTAPSDNSCLFTSVLFSVENADGKKPIETTVVTNPAAVAQLRELIASIVLSDPERYSEGFLGMPNERYSQCIQEPDRWGGGIEVSILSQVYEVEICVVDIQTVRIDRFGEDQNYHDRILLIYDGIHYDPLALARPETGRLTSVFSTKNQQILWDAETLAAEARAAWRFTDTASFTLICRKCQVPLVGQTAAQQHAKNTGHTDFSEIPSV